MQEKHSVTQLPIPMSNPLKPPYRGRKKDAGLTRKIQRKACRLSSMQEKLGNDPDDLIQSAESIEGFLGECIGQCVNKRLQKGTLQKAKDAGLAFEEARFHEALLARQNAELDAYLDWAFWEYCTPEFEAACAVAFHEAN
jgi:hypothetical protein